MNETTKKVLSYSLEIILVILIVVAIVKYEKNKDNGLYDYCVEWGGWIDRDNMVMNCYDFERLQPKCGWEEKGNILEIYTYPNGTSKQSYNCTRYVKSIQLIVDRPVFQGG